jgi:hypothetical protein
MDQSMCTLMHVGRTHLLYNVSTVFPRRHFLNQMHLFGDESVNLLHQSKPLQPAFGQAAPDDNDDDNDDDDGGDVDGDDTDGNDGDGDDDNMWVSVTRTTMTIATWVGIFDNDNDNNGYIIVSE